jgi:hypothetical protein
MDPFFIFAAFAPLIGAGTALYLGFRFVRAFERRSSSRNELEQLRAHLARVEEELARTNAEVERLAEDQRFTVQLLAERATSIPKPFSADGEGSE